MNLIREKIEIIKAERLEYNIQTPNPILDIEIDNFKRKYKSFFVTDVDEEYLSFLKICDGLYENGYHIYASNDHIIDKIEYGIFQNNELWYEEYDKDKEYIFFAESGTDLFVFNKIEKKYLLLDRSSGEIYETFETFNEMLLYILKLMLYEEIE